MKAITKKALCLVWSGTFEQRVKKSHIINHLRKKQRSVTITLLDLKNAFVEAHHLLIQSVLCYHYKPDEINCIVKILYNDFHLSIITNDFHTKYVAVEKGFLQGDLFHLWFLHNVLKKKNSLVLGIVHSKVFFPATGFSSRMTLLQ